ncbi:MAG: LytR/AlgR family response regulator transcription factor [Bacteroidales bacterium]
MISAVIIDDEELACDTLETMLNRYFIDKVRVLQKTNTVKDGVMAILKHKPDLVFLDIEMPGENGFKLFEYFKEISFSVVITTEHQSFAIDALKVAALDYILKPVKHIDLQHSISLYEKKVKKDLSQDKVERLFKLLNPFPDVRSRVAFPTFTGFQLEKIDSVIYCEADQNYTKIFTNRGDSFLVSKPISYIEGILPKDLFFRIHKSYLLNLNFIKSYNKKDGLFVELENGKLLEVASRRNHDFLKALTGK